jgi:membrane-bound lytic murein transglycosylase B
MASFFFKKHTIIILIIILVFPAISPLFAATNLDEAEAKLREELRQLEEEQAEVQASLNMQKAQTASIKRDVNLLEDQIYSAELNIQKKNLEIQRLQDVIELKRQTISELDEKMERSQQALAELIRQTNDIDNTSLPEIILSKDSLTDFFFDLDSYVNLQNQLEDLFTQIREIRGEAESEKEELTHKQNDEVDLKQGIQQEKKTIETKKTEKDYLLNVSQQVETTYETVLAEKRKRASEIRTALFQLRDSAGIPFGEALEYAQEAERVTGVRAAFILGVLKQESDLGKNVGTCNRVGDPESKKWYSIMPGPNDNSWRDDQTIFLRITDKLGLDPDTTPLSCPWAGGWGGAMGPSQFIPVTWSGYEARIASAVGVKTPNPWDPEHAIMATALYVKDLGAAAGGYTAERTAALKYYAGSNWNLPQNAFYGNSVINHATGIQEQIDFLEDLD